jgi:SAM-dependent methyltransferase
MNLRSRSTQAERMDTDCADYDDYARCLRDLSRVNVVTLTHRPMLRWLARRATGAFSVLDVACGFGDGLRAVRRRFPEARLVGVDLNPWAVRAARAATDPAMRIAFLQGDAFAYAPDEPVDFIVCSQFTHHLTDEEVVAYLAWLRAKARRGWFISDIHRHVLPYYGFPVLARMAGWHRLVREDGQVSIARGFVPAEWRVLLARAGLEGQAAVTWHVPFRLCVGSL